MLVVALLVAACGDSGGSSSTVASSVGATTSQSSTAPETESAAPSTTATSTTLVVDGIEVAGEVIEFIAAVDELLVDTVYEDAVTEDPEVFVATGRLLCEQLDQGMSPTEMLGVYVETLTGRDIEEADDDSLTLAGSLLGTAVGYLCPEHTELLEESF